jgi:catechol 2,3-dioxygenase-like lactoylglutathione lyase family enzyme
MAEFPTISHVALTVSDLNRSVPWYQALFGSDPVIDEDTGPFRHVVWMLGGRTLVGLHQFASPSSNEAFTELRPGLDHLASQSARTAANSNSGKRDSASWVSTTAESWARRTARSLIPRPRQHRTRVLRTPWLKARRRAHAVIRPCSATAC